MGQPVRGVGVRLLDGALSPSGRESQPGLIDQVARHQALADEPGRGAPSHRQEGARGPRQNRPRQVSFFFLLIEIHIQVTLSFKKGLSVGYLSKSSLVLWIDCKV